MNRHPGGEEHTSRLIGLAGLPKNSKILDMGAGGGETVHLLNEMGYDALGIDTDPREENVQRGDMLCAPFADGSFDGVISQCAFNVSGDIDGAFSEARRLLRAGGMLMISDVDFADLKKSAEAAGFKVLICEDMTAAWREYYLEAIWRGDAEYTPGRGKCSYKMLICRKE